MSGRPPLVLVHGLWDTPRLFRRLEAELHGRCDDITLFAPHLPHRLGATPLRQLAARGELRAWRHHGFWRAMDTLRDRNQLEELWAGGQAPWKLW
jgi:NDP-sugar pyrophosphorylase family protein